MRQDRHRWQADFPRSRLALSIAVVALLFSGLSVIFWALQWHEARDQTSLTGRPLLDFSTNFDDQDPKVGLAVVNTGVGPAVIKSVSFFVDHKPVSDIDDVAAKILGKPNDDLFDGIDLSDGSSVAAGETIWLFFRSTKNRKALDKFIDFVDKQLAVEITYCSNSGMWCRTKCSADRCGDQE